VPKEFQTVVYMLYSPFFLIGSLARGVRRLAGSFCVLDVVVRMLPHHVHAVHLVYCLGQHGVPDHSEVRSIDVCVPSGIDVSFFCFLFGDVEEVADYQSQLWGNKI
jgi:hypothetical protein